MPKRGKKYQEIVKLVDKTKSYSIDEALELVKKVSYSKFDGTVEMHVVLGIDPKKSDQNVRGTISLPKGTGKKVRVLVFAEGENAEQARQAGADYVGSDDFINKISSEGWTDFDVAISTPDMMRKIAKLGKVLGPRGLMPSPKAGTVTENVAQAVKDFKSGKVEIRNDRTGNVHIPIGKVSFAKEDLKENLLSALEQLSKMKPESAKGKFINKVVIAPTMGVGINIDLSTEQLKVA
ncbi:50S ribosomal protein L1 [Petrotoga sp. 9PWA.NaAc.5.4]|uniref:50S ribosomal protein L1 n=1 Tax=Petrotoga sp. 9PWA.NaAc.5.4 TaxID=1434328 RepID=UPI000CB2C3A7|nr:50S ribosomal protein L1 [Petrotoga sp. 9PWA.NaAc.5.4]PNR95946.1 50S ribosomal protein L1 [Petrotoga sp. 9PWA.NaAc.5.4]